MRTKMDEASPTVLIVEDEESFVDALTIGLKREGFVVQVALDGITALSVFDAVKPDLVLLDVMLPGLSGVDVCREIRRRSRTPIIMVTAKGSEIDTVVGLEVGADDYVTNLFVLAGQGRDSGDGSNIESQDAFGSPDGLWVDPDGRVWIQTDGRQPAGANNQMLAANPYVTDAHGVPRSSASSPVWRGARSPESSQPRTSAPCSSTSSTRAKRVAAPGPETTVWPPHVRPPW